MINYGIFFTKDKTVVRLPINPEKLPDTLEGNNETYNVLGLGDITVPRIPQQRVVEISSYFPATATFEVLTPNKFWTPDQYIEFFRTAMRDGDILTYTPVRYMENGTAFGSSDPGFKCTVESFNVEERGGETGDFYYTLTIKEYRDYAPQTVKVQVQQQKKVITTTPARETAQDELYVGKPVQVNGPVYQQMTTAPETPKQVSGQTAEVARIDNNKEAAYLVKDMVTHGLIGWAVKESLQAFVNTAKTGGSSTGGGRYTAMTK